jgi:hypothetical protein
MNRSGRVLPETLEREAERFSRYFVIPDSSGLGLSAYKVAA